MIFKMILKDKFEQYLQDPPYANPRSLQDEQLHRTLTRLSFSELIRRTQYFDYHIIFTAQQTESAPSITLPQVLT